MAKKPRTIPGPSSPPAGNNDNADGDMNIDAAGDPLRDFSQENHVPAGDDVVTGEHVDNPALPAAAVVTVPRAAIDPRAYMPAKVEARLTTQQRRGLKMLLGGLQQEHLQLASGRHVDTPPDAVRWLLEQIADGTPA